MSTALELAGPFVAIICIACGAACLLYAWTRRPLMAKLFWHNLLRLIHESRRLPLSRSQVWARLLTEACEDNKSKRST